MRIGSGEGTQPCENSIALFSMNSTEAEGQAY
jgi:hypothetical protein